MEFRAYDLQDKRVTFGINACPNLIDKNIIALTNVKYSRLLKVGSVMRCINGYWEGSAVYSDGEYIGALVYVKGLCIARNPTTLEKFTPVPYIEVRGDEDRSVKLAIAVDRTEIKVKMVNRLYNIYNFIKSLDDDRVVYEDGTTVNLKHLNLYTGIDIDLRKLCENDAYLAGVIKFHNGQPSIYCKGEYQEIKEM